MDGMRFARHLYTLPPARMLQPCYQMRKTSLTFIIVVIRANAETLSPFIELANINMLTTHRNDSELEEVFFNQKSESH